MAEGKTEINPQTPSKRFLSGIFGAKPVSIKNTVEQEIKSPQLSIDLFFSHHRTSEDFKGLRERVMQSDIYMPELVGWEQRDVDLFNVVSKGSVSPEEAVGEGPARDAFLGILKAIHNSQKPIAFVDLSANDLNHRKAEEPLNSLRTVFKDFEKNLDNMRNILINSAKLQKQREIHIASQIKPRVEEMINIHPELRNKNTLRVLLSLGYGHDPLFSRLQEEGVSLENNSRKSAVESDTSLFDEAYQQLVFGKSVDKGFLAKIFLENLFLNSGSLDRNITKESKKIFMLTRKLFSDSSMEYAKEVFDRFKKQESLRKILEQKFGPLPKNEQELDDFLARPSNLPVESRVAV